MPSDTIVGKDVLLYFLVNGIYQQAACATECTLNVYTNTVEITTRTNNAGQGTWRKIKPTDNYWEASVSGIQLLDAPVKFSDIRAMQVALIPIYIQYAKTSQSGLRYENWFGRGVITSSEETGGVDEFATFDIKIEGDGVLRADFDPTNINQPIEMFYYYTATGNEGRAIHIPALQGFAINGRIYRDGYENDPSGTLTMNRPGTDTPTGNQYQWNSNTAYLILSQDSPPPSSGERITIPYTNNYSGCSLIIQNFRASLNASNRFFFSWDGTGLPESQLLFEYSSDYGTTWTVIDTDIDTLNLDNSVYNTALDTSAGYIFGLTPICTNGQKGKRAVAYWNATTITIINTNANGALLRFIGFKKTDLTDATISCLDADNNQLAQASTNVNPYHPNKALLIYMLDSTIPYTLTVKDMSGTVIGTGDNAHTLVVLSIEVPNEFQIIIS